MNKIGLGKCDVVTIFRRIFTDEVEGDPLVKAIAKAVGEVIEENNKKLLEDLADDSRKAGRNL